MGKTYKKDSHPDKGKKDDEGKPDWTLFPFKAAEYVVRVLEFGAMKYGRNNWKEFIRKPDGPQRCLAAAQRHMAEFIDGDEVLDRESNIHHIAHAACNLLFYLKYVDNHSDLGKMMGELEERLAKQKEEKKVVSTT